MLIKIMVIARNISKELVYSVYKKSINLDAIKTLKAIAKIKGSNKSK